jgi:hypothetical protein
MLDKFINGKKGRIGLAEVAGPLQRGHGHRFPPWVMHHDAQVQAGEVIGLGGAGDVVGKDIEPPREGIVQMGVGVGHPGWGKGGE